MQLTFNEAEVKEILIKHAATFGITANEVDFDIGYSAMRSATLSFVAPKPVTTISYAAPEAA